MKTTALAAAGVLAVCTALPVLAANVDVSINFGRVDVGRYPHPVLVAPRPVLAAPPPRRVAAPAPAPAPVYLYAPVAHQRHWRRHCADDRACGAPVYFVQERWYHDRVAADRWDRRDDRRDGRHDRHDNRHDDRHDRRDDRRDDRHDRRP